MRLIHGLPYEAWSRELNGEQVVYLIPVAVPGLPDGLVGVLARRRQAVLTGRCPCGAIPQEDVDKDGYDQVTFVHDLGCPLADDRWLHTYRKFVTAGLS